MQLQLFIPLNALTQCLNLFNSINKYKKITYLYVSI